MFFYYEILSTPDIQLFLQLDEAHNIKERSTNTAKATFELKAKYRWCLSGTPLQNRVGERELSSRSLETDTKFDDSI